MTWSKEWLGIVAINLIKIEKFQNLLCNKKSSKYVNDNLKHPEKKYFKILSIVNLYAKFW